MLVGKTIILGVSSSIAAYKACEIVSRLKKLGANVWVVMTKSATELVTPNTFRALSGNPVIVDLFSNELSSLPVPHISLAQKADLLVVAPATANVIGKLAHGIGDDALTTFALAVNGPKLIAPAMNCEMWRNSMVADNVRKLRSAEFGMWNIIGPETGRLACGDEDIGRMSEPAEIVAQIALLLGAKDDFQGKKVLITAGGTRENIDPVRYIGNRSSGKMGYALAEAARDRGADVTLISGPTKLTVPSDVKFIGVENTKEMYKAVLASLDQADVVIMTAAVADYKADSSKRSAESRKIKKSDRKLTLTLKPTEDILKSISQQKNRKNKVLVGFALETDNLEKNAREKLKDKNLDLIVANGPATFDSDEIKFSLIDRTGKINNLPQQPKPAAANLILDRVQAML
jgi:phosphopantothenoylcysteine decarboxylase/phosphopantothenate--cysteine ligase